MPRPAKNDEIDVLLDLFCSASAEIELAEHVCSPARLGPGRGWVTLKRRVCLPGEGHWVNAWRRASFLVGSAVLVCVWL